MLQVQVLQWKGFASRALASWLWEIQSGARFQYALILELSRPSTKMIQNVSTCYVYIYIYIIVCTYHIDFFLRVTIWNWDLELLCTCILHCSYACILPTCLCVSLGIDLGTRLSWLWSQLSVHLNSLVFVPILRLRWAGMQPSPSSNMRANKKWLWRDELQLKPTNTHWKLLYQEKLESERTRNHYESKSILASKSYTI